MRPIDADALIEFCAERWIPLNIDAVNMQPTIQPEKRTEKRTETHARDLISRQAALDIFDDYNVSVEMGELEAYSRDRKRLCELSSVQPEPQWIPVSERMPEESEYYIITANDGVGHRTTFAKFQKKAKSWDLTGARSYWRVIAWMPLPKPFEGGIK